MAGFSVRPSRNKCGYCKQECLHIKASAVTRIYPTQLLRTLAASAETEEGWGQETRTAPNPSAQAKSPRETESAGFETEGTRAYHDIVLLSASAHTDKRIKSRDGREELAALIRPSLAESLSTKPRAFDVSVVTPNFLHQHYWVNLSLIYNLSDSSLLPLGHD